MNAKIGKTTAFKNAQADLEGEVTLWRKSSPLQGPQAHQRADRLGK